MSLANGPPWPNNQPSPPKLTRKRSKVLIFVYRVSSPHWWEALCARCDRIAWAMIKIALLVGFVYWLLLNQPDMKHVIKAVTF